VQQLIEWAVGVTTVQARLNTLLPATLNSLAAGGFGGLLRLFVDGCRDPKSVEEWCKLPVSTRSQQLGIAGSWMLTLHELYLRQPRADYYLIFQDDVAVLKNLRHYLEQSPLPRAAFGNLFLARGPHKVLKARWPKVPVGWHKSDQKCRGAQGLLFPNPAARALLLSTFANNWPNTVKGDRNVDGMIVQAMNQAGYDEWVHCPTLCEHTGRLSTVGHGIMESVDTWRGEDYDSLELLEGPCPTTRRQAKGGA